MVKLDLVKSSNAELVTQPLVAVFVGGTSGIGSYTVKTLARTHGKTGAVYEPTLSDEMSKQQKESYQNARPHVHQDNSSSNASTTLHS